MTESISSQVIPVDCSTNSDADGGPIKIGQESGFISNVKEDYGSCDIPEAKNVAQHDLNNRNTNNKVLPSQPPESELAIESSLDRFFHNQRSQIKYYKIVYRGVVALLSDPELESPKSGGKCF